MYSVLLTIHVLVTLFLIGIILIQRSASDGMGLSASSSNSFLSGRAAASAVTRATAILATIFIFTSLGLGILTTRSHANEGSILDKLNTAKPAVSAPVAPANSGGLNSPAGAPVTPDSSVVPAVPTVNAPGPATPSVPRPE